MRRYGLYISLFVALFTSSLLTSCDEDLEEAYTLAGEWYGDFGMRLPTEEVENDPVLSSLPSQNCITLIRDHKE